MNAIRVAWSVPRPSFPPTSAIAALCLPAVARSSRILTSAFARKTGLPVSVADDPLASVVLGTGKMLSDFRLLRKIKID